MGRNLVINSQVKKLSVVPFRASGGEFNLTADHWNRAGSIFESNDMNRDCSSFSVDLSAYFDGELEDEKSARLKSHLDECEKCSASLEKLRMIRQAMGSIGKGPRKPGVSILDSLREKLEAEKQVKSAKSSNSSMVS